VQRLAIIYCSSICLGATGYFSGRYTCQRAAIDYRVNLSVRELQVYHQVRQPVREPEVGYKVFVAQSARELQVIYQVGINRLVIR
jgi:hypothetical protein